MSHTPEPWKVGADASILAGDVYVGGYADVERIVSCVNACQGMADPAKEIAEMEAALKEAADAINEARECVFWEVNSWRAVDANLPKGKSALAKIEALNRWEE